MAYDGKFNFGYATIGVAPSPATSGTTLGIANSTASRFSDPASVGAYNVIVFPAGQLPLASNAEILRFTAKGAADSAGAGYTQFTMTRTQDGTSARSIQVGDQIQAGATKKWWDDIEKNKFEMVTVAPAGTPATYNTDGTADDVEIQAAIDAVSTAGGGVVHLKKGSYVLAATLVMANDVSLVGEGFVSKLVPTSGSAIASVTSATAGAIQIAGKSRVVIKNIGIDGTNQGTNDAGIFISGSSDVRVEMCHLVNMGGFGIFTASGWVGSSDTCERIVLCNNYAQGNGNNDVFGGGKHTYTSNTTDVKIYGNEIVQDCTTNSYNTALDLVGVNRLLVENNNIRGNIVFGTEQTPNQYSSIIGNTVRPAINTTTCTIQVSSGSTAVESSTNIVIANNVLDSIGTISVNATSSPTYKTKNVTITGNAITSNTSVSGIQLLYVSQAVVSGNTVDGALSGVQIGNSDNIEVSTNVFSNCTNGVNDQTGVASINIGHNTFNTVTNKVINGNTTLTTSGINDSNGNEEIIFTTTASAFNEITVANAATTGSPTISATGGDSNVALVLKSKGTGSVTAQPGTNSASAFKVLSSSGGTTVFQVDTSNNRAGIGATPTSTLYVNGPIGTVLANKTTTYTITATDSVITADATSAGFTVTLPTAASIAGRQYTIKKVDSSGNAVTVGTTSSQTIDGSTTYALSSQYAAVTVASNGTNWEVLSKTVSASGSGDVVGPGSATDNALTRFDTTTGKLIQNSTAILLDDGSLGLGTSPSNPLHLVKSNLSSGAAALFDVTQTTVNTSDLSDAAFNLKYGLTASSASNELVARIFKLDFTNTLTGGGAITNARVLNIATNTAASTTVTNLDAILIETGTTSGAVTTVVGLHIATLQGTTKWGIKDDSGGNWTLTGQIHASPGSATTPGYAFFGGTGEGMYRDPSPAILWAVGGSEKMRLNGTGLGIGVTPNSNLQTNGAIATPLATKTANYTITASDSIILADATSGAITITLPTAASITGRVYTIKKIDSANTVTIATTSSQTIDGATTQVITSRYTSINVVSDGSNWFII